MHYIMKPKKTEAVQWTGYNLLEVYEFVFGPRPVNESSVLWKAWEHQVTEKGLVVQHVVVNKDDWILKDEFGNLSRMEDSMFNSLYQSAEVSCLYLADTDWAEIHEDLPHYKVGKEEKAAISELLAMCSSDPAAMVATYVKRIQSYGLTLGSLLAAANAKGNLQIQIIIRMMVKAYGHQPNPKWDVENPRAAKALFDLGSLPVYKQ